MHAWLARFEGLLNRGTRGQSRGTKPLQGGACRKATWLECTTFPLGQVHPQCYTLDPFGIHLESIWVSFRFGTGFVPFEVMPERSWESFSFLIFCNDALVLYNNRVRAQVHVSAAALCIKTCMLPYSPKTRRTDFVVSSWSSCVSMILHDSYIILYIYIYTHILRYTQYILNIF